MSHPWSGSAATKVESNTACVCMTVQYVQMWGNSLHMLLFNLTLWQPQGLTWGMVTWYQPVHFVSKVFDSVHISHISRLRTTSFGVSEHPLIKWTIRKKVEEIISFIFFVLFFFFWGGGGGFIIYYTQSCIYLFTNKATSWLVMGLGAKQF